MGAEEGLVGKTKGFSPRGEDKGRRLQRYVIKSTKISKITSLLESSAMKIDTVTSGCGGAHL